MPDSSQWRSATHYDHVDALSGSDLAWEWLRRNQAYQADFKAFASTDGDASVAIAAMRGDNYDGRLSGNYDGR